MDLYFLRHTTVAVDNDVCYGQTEIPVASSFLQEAADTMKLVPDKMHAVYFSSPTRRCIQLAEFISKRPAMQDDRLADLNFNFILIVYKCVHYQTGTAVHFTQIQFGFAGEKPQND